MTNGLPFYKAYPRDFIEGTIGMSFEEKAAYRLVLDLIYMQGGRLVDDDRYIAGLLGCTPRKWRGLRERLIALGKIYVTGGKIGNHRADDELKSTAVFQRKQSENRAKTPRKSRENAAKNDPKNPNGATKRPKNRRLKKPTFDHTDTDTDTDTEEVVDTSTLTDSSQPSHLGSTVVGAKTKKTDYSAMMPDAQITDAWQAAAIEVGLPEHLVEDCHAEFVEYWAGAAENGTASQRRSARKTARGWLACWRNNCRRQAERLGGTLGNQHADRSAGRYRDARGTGRPGVAATLARMERELSAGVEVSDQWTNPAGGDRVPRSTRDGERDRTRHDGTVVDASAWFQHDKAPADTHLGAVREAGGCAGSRVDD